MMTIPGSDALRVARDRADRIAGAIATISQAEDDGARERAWRNAMADQTVAVEIRRLTQGQLFDHAEA
jgi:hypothetical protein